MTLKTGLSIHKIKILHKVSLLLLIAVGFAVKPEETLGQASSDAPSFQERIYVHLDKPVYVTGEFMKYKIYLLNGTSHRGAPCSKILYFTLTDASGKSRADWRINMDSGSESGSFAIPADINNGIYDLRVYTNDMRNEPVNRIYSQDVLIINLSNETPDTLSDSQDELKAALHQVRDGEKGSVVHVRTSKDTFLTGEKVRLEISLEGNQSADTSADLSASVSLVTPFQKLIPETDIYTCLNTANYPANAGVPCKYRLEDKSFILSGRIRNRITKTPLVNARILLAVADSIAPKIQFTTTDSEGEFHFYLGRIFDNKELILQFGDNSRNADCLWEINPKVLDGSHEPLSTYSLREEELNFLNVAKDLRLIEAVYEGVKTREDAGSIMDYTNFFSPADVIIKPSEFSDLANFKEIADNIIPCVKFIKRDNAFSMQVLNERTNVWQETRLLLLNGVPYTDMTYIATLGTKDIRRIEVITRNYLLGDLTIPGVVSIYTYDNRLPENYLSNNTIRYRNAVMTNDPPKTLYQARQPGEHDPDFRSTLYWNPQIHISSKEKWVVEFPASQLKGLYSVKVRGLAGFTQAVSSDTFFEVK